MLKRLSIENFKSYQEATLPFAPISLLIGTNASGKSNALEALAILAWAARTPRLADLAWAVSQGALQLRGSPAELVRTGADSFVVEIEVEHPAPLGRLILRLELAELHGGLVVRRERLDAPECGSPIPLYSAEPDASGVGLNVAYNNFARGGRKPHVSCSADVPVFTQFTTPARIAKAHARAAEWIPEAALAVRMALEGIQFLDPAPQAMRGWVPTPTGALAADGSNLSGVLKALWDAANSDAKKQVLSLVRELPQERIEALTFLSSPRREAMVCARETFGGQARDIPAALLSDGTLRVLAIAAAMVSAPPGRLVVIEEVDNGIHPSRAHAVLASIAGVAHQRQLRVLITSHNPAMLDALPTDAQGDVVVCHRIQADGSSRLTRLRDTPEFVRMTARGGLGRQMMQGAIERAVRVEAGASTPQVAEWLAALGIGG
jgi:predicted ATPase